ncbi:glycosyltransferase family 2 protein [Companilactobacillus jidongensis]|jgi:rhamnosyltransferase|uniref:glycosyltransferase family 2 protein n=1 Tax=Companilactobacillus jidongensis TaxID=2486006 RepID=UPI000F7670A5|nr:glycosyltransferase [Companilactobacillus jidongensis]
MKLGLFIPTYNAGNEFEKVLSEIDDSLNQLGFEVERLIIDSFSDDNTVSIAEKHGFDVKKISRKEFTHGEVRRRAAISLKNCEYIIYMTQDVFLHKNAIKEILNFIINHPNMAVAYGKQESDVLKTNILEQRSREFNYPNVSQIKSKKDIPKLGIKTVFSSDAFSIYRWKLLMKIGSFPKGVKYCEDMFIAAKAINSGYEVGYCANAVVTHSNKMNLKQQFKRYRSIGAFHKQNPWIQDEFGSNESEGIKMVVSEWKFLFKKNKMYLIPYSFFMKVIKFIAYKF